MKIYLANLTFSVYMILFLTIVEKINILRQYHEDLKPYSEPLSSETEHELARQGEIGDLVLHNIGLAWAATNKAMASRSASAPPVEKADVLQEVTVDLIHQAERFDPNRGCRLSTFAMPRLTRAARRATMTQAIGIIWATQHYIDGTTQVSRANDGLDRLSTEKIAEAIGRSATDVAKLANNYTRSLDTHSLDDPERKSPDFHETISDSTTNRPLEEEVFRRLSRRDAQIKLQQAIDSAHLTEEERYVITRRNGLFCEKPQTRKEIAADLGCCPNTVTNRKNSALAKIKEHLNSRG